MQPTAPVEREIDLYALQPGACLVHGRVQQASRIIVATGHANGNLAVGNPLAQIFRQCLLAFRSASHARLRVDPQLCHVVVERFQPCVIARWRGLREAIGSQGARKHVVTGDRVKHARLLPQP